MRTYRVEEIDGASIVSTHEVDAKTPFEAAEIALGVAVTLRGNGDAWIRVVDLAAQKQPTRLRPASFEFKSVGKLPIR